MSGEFAVLTSRSIFVHGFARPERSGPEQSGGPPALTREQIVEQSFVFNGATRVDNEAVALLEDTNAQKVLKVKVGQPIAAGKITNITLDKLEYTAARSGKAVSVAIGHNLEGGEALAGALRPTPFSSAVGATTGPTSGPAGTPSGAMGQREKLRLRRLQELGGK
jgi:hypothetical protein